jgi:hypothetical protein
MRHDNVSACNFLLQTGQKFRGEMEAKILKWQEPPPAKIVKPLEKPDAEVRNRTVHHITSMVRPGPARFSTVQHSTVHYLLVFARGCCAMATSCAAS